MIVFLNGQFVDERQAMVSVFDRSFQYGDGLFETLRVCKGRPFRWDQHLQRLQQASKGLGLRLPFQPRQLKEAVDELLRLNRAREAVLRIALSRGVGRRGYSPRGADQPVLVVSSHPVAPLRQSPRRWRLVTSSFRLNAADPLSRWKTNNKLIQVLARREAESQGADEALLLNDRGEVCETSSGNVFWVEDDQLVTPPAGAGLLPGITRGVILELAPLLGVTVAERPAPLDTLRGSAGAFVTLSSLGMVEVAALDGHLLPRHPRTVELYQRYRKLLAGEEAGERGASRCSLSDRQGRLPSTRGARGAAGQRSRRSRG